MDRKDIKVMVDYSTGSYTVLGKKNGKETYVLKPIRGFDSDSFFKANFSRKLIRYRRHQIVKRLIFLEEMDPTFEFSDNLVKKVDPLLFKTLEEYDKYNGTKFADNYLKAVTKKYNIKNKTECRKRRTKAMKDAGIDVSYNIGWFKMGESLTTTDIFRGLRFARNQEKLYGARVNSKIVAVRNYFLNETNQFLYGKNVKKEDNNEKITEKDVEKEETTGKAVTQKRFVNFNTIKTKINDGKRHWTRKLRDAQDSIKNKKFIPHFSDKAKKMVISGAVTLLALGIVAFGTNSVKNYSKQNVETSKSSISYEIEREVDDGSDIIVEVSDKSSINDISQQESENEIGTTSKEEVESKVEIEKMAESKAETESANSIIEENKNKAENKTEVKKDSKVKNKKSEKEKIAEFNEVALQKYKNAIVIGKKPAIGDLLKNQTFSENPDGTGKKGKFSKDSNYTIEHINIVTEDGWKVVRTEGKSLNELLAEYPDCTTYSVHFVNSENGGGLGFVTQEQYEKLVQNEVNKIIESRTTNNIELNIDDLMR